MKRFWVWAVAIAVIGAGIWVGLRLAEQPSNAAVSSLLPRGTIAFVHLPDFNATITQWHHSDIYRIYREPAVQDFLQKPRSRATKRKTVSATVSEIQELDPKDAFLALTSLANDKPKMVAGFRFRSSAETANRVIADWRTKIKGGAQPETVTYQQHRIEVVSQPTFPLATVQDRDWFFASNDIEELKQILDRADGRNKDRKSLLRTDAVFKEAMHAMPSSYALLFYLQPKTFSDRIAAVRSALAPSGMQNRPSVIEQIHSICATTRFDDGKLHDVIFLGMPRQEENARLTRSSLTLGTRATFLYLASLINFSKQAALFSPKGGANFLGARVGKIANALADAGIAADDWKLAFSPEAGILADWSQDVRWPSLIASVPVKDRAHAKKITEALTHGMDEDAVWEETDQNGVHYWSMQTQPTLLSVRPVIALSNQVLIAGLDEASVQAAIERSEKDQSELASSDTYKHAAHAIPAPTNFFTYLDLGVLYARLDATLRPMLMIVGPFVPTINDYVDLSKLPPAEAITKHLSPIVCSQRYAGKGYIAESIGPITLNQAGIGVGLLAGLGALSYQRSGLGALSGLGFPGSTTPPASPSPSARSAKTPSAGPKAASPAPSDTP